MNTFPIKSESQFERICDVKAVLINEIRMFERFLKNLVTEHQIAGINIFGPNVEKIQIVETQNSKVKKRFV